MLRPDPMQIAKLMNLPATGGQLLYRCLAGYTQVQRAASSFGCTR